MFKRYFYNCFSLKSYAPVYSSNTPTTKKSQNINNDNFTDIIPSVDVNINEKYLQDINYKNTIPFVPPITEGKVIKVYDGDTFTIASKLPYDSSPIYRFSVRLNGIDAPEMKCKTNVEKLHAVKSRDALSSIILHKKVKLTNIKTEKYGRILADVYVDEMHINKWMLDNKYAVQYNGGTKIKPPEWEIEE
jgi:endonuclease YncB( thermonuclease family)